MIQKQINLTLPEELLKAANDYGNRFGYRNLQELATECLRQRVFEKDFDEDITPKEIELIDRFIDVTLSKPKSLVGKKELDKALLG
jgi:hypothetical protein